MFCKHKWRETARTYKPTPFSHLSGIESFEGGGSWMFKDKTTILWECEICQDLRKEEMEGKIVAL